MNANLVDQTFVDNNLNQDKQYENFSVASTETTDDQNLNNSVIIMKDTPSSLWKDSRSTMEINQPYEVLTADGSPLDRLSYNQLNSVQRNSVSQQTLVTLGYLYQPIFLGGHSLRKVIDNRLGNIIDKATIGETITRQHYVKSDNSGKIFGFKWDK